MHLYNFEIKTKYWNFSALGENSSLKCLVLLLKHFYCGKNTQNNAWKNIQLKYSKVHIIPPSLGETTILSFMVVLCLLYIFTHLKIHFELYIFFLLMKVI